MESVVFEALKNWSDFKGRAGRREYWMFVLLVFLASIGLSILNIPITLVTGNPSSPIFWVLYALFFLAVIVPSLSVGFRRLHDTNRSAWWLLISFVPLVGSVVLLVFYCLPGTPGSNRFGPAPGAPNDLETTFA